MHASGVNLRFGYDLNCLACPILLLPIGAACCSRASCDSNWPDPVRVHEMEASYDLLSHQDCRYHSRPAKSSVNCTTYLGSNELPTKPGLHSLCSSYQAD